MTTSSSNIREKHSPNTGEKKQWKRTVIVVDFYDEGGEAGIKTSFQGDKMSELAKRSVIEHILDRIPRRGYRGALDLIMDKLYL